MPQPTAVRLPDGRSLSYYDFGDPDGRPVLLLHGTPQAAIGWAFADEPARELGIRALAPDRPGIGRSSPQPGRTLTDYPSDLLALADALGLDRFAVLGWSAGGPYALACGAAVPERLTAVGCVAGSCPLDWPGVLADLNAQDRRMVQLSRRAPRVARAALAASAAAARHAPGLTMRWSRGQLSPSERAEAERHRAALADLDWFLDAFRQGTGGVLDDYRVYSAPWGFEPSSVRTRTTLWSGDDDSLVPLRHAQLLAEQIPGAKLEIVRGAGHLLPYDHVGALLGELAPGQ
jgi:pimeloyl-ACP methyl ester carboxylesterase